MTNELVKIFKSNMDKPWNLFNLTCNPNISLDLICEFKTFPWDIQDIYSNPETISNNVDELLRNNNINVELYTYWDWHAISQHPRITMEFIELHKHRLWFCTSISCNPNLTLEIVKKYEPRNWSWRSISCNENITWDIISTNKKLPWDWVGIAMNPNITWEIIQDNLELSSFSSNARWPWFVVVQNPNITLDNIENRPDILLDWPYLSYNTNITGEFIMKHEHEQWFWDAVCRNPNITLEDIEMFLSSRIPFSWHEISCNPNLTLDFINKHHDKPWNWGNISSNLFGKHPHLIKKERLNKVKCWKRMLNTFDTS